MKCMHIHYCTKFKTCSNKKTASRIIYRNMMLNSSKEWTNPSFS